MVYVKAKRNLSIEMESRVNLESRDKSKSVSRRYVNNKAAAKLFQCQKFFLHKI